jgi:PTH1 family peptidyl-tRNA hydrolase
VVGLRNPGRGYSHTRHNLGADVVAVVASRWGASFKRARRTIRAEVSETHISGVRTVLAMPTTFMNDSGRAVAPLLRYFDADLYGLLVVHDDIDLPFARLRLHYDRGSGGNNGARSIIRSLRTQEFWRLKCGVGRPPGRMDPAEYVLHRFTGREQPEIDLLVEQAADVVEKFITDGGPAAQQLTGGGEGGG